MLAPGVLVPLSRRTVKERRSRLGRSARVRRIAIYRDPELTERQAAQIIAAAKLLYGKPYDIFFSLNNDAIYCSELPYLAYNAAGLSIGKVEKVSDLHFDNALVRRLHPTALARNIIAARRATIRAMTSSTSLSSRLVTYSCRHRS